MNEALLSVEVGDRVWFFGEVKPYRVRAKGLRYIVLTKPMNIYHTVLYTVVDLLQDIRGAENLIFCAGAETDVQCLEMLGRLETGETEVSHRNRVDLAVVRVSKGRS